MFFGAAAADQAEKMAPLSKTSTQLIMVEQDGCIYCARWNAEISDIYPKTPEGKFAPLRRMDLRAEPPKDITFKGPLAITPTFVLVENGVEQARIEGYGGDEMFWAMLTVTLQNHSDFGEEATE
ncbi:thioredoxin family protein [Pacificibacter marinus]|nr:thioredoxin family protein [Pacificibacter marinus]